MNSTRLKLKNEPDNRFGMSLSNLLLILVAGVIVLIMVISLSITSTCWYGMGYCMDDVSNWLPLVVIPTILAIAVSIIINSKKIAITPAVSKKILMGVLLAVTLVGLVLIVVFNGRVWYTADSRSIIEYLQNTSNIKASSYFEVFPYQSGLVAFIGVMWKIFGIYNFMPFYLFNLVAILSVIYLVYRITLKLTINNYRVALVALVTTSLFVPFYYYVSTIYGDIVGLPIALLIVYLFLIVNSNNWKKIAPLMIAASVAMIFFKSMLIIVLFALLISALINKSTRKKRIGRIAIVLCCVIMGTIINNMFASLYANHFNIGKRPDAQRELPKVSWIAMGLQSGQINNRNDKVRSETLKKATSVHEYDDSETPPGMYNDFIFVDYNEQSKNMDKIAKKYIAKSLDTFMNNPSYAVKFFKYKLAYEWGNPSFATYINKDNVTMWTGNYIVESLTPGWIKSIYTTNESIQIYEKYYQVFIYISSLLGAVFVLTNKKRHQLIDNDSLCTIITIIGCGFGTFLLWESSSRYVIPYFIMMIPLASLGLYLLYPNLRKLAVKAVNSKNKKSNKSKEDGCN